ncbi:hypothetical protein EV191_103108 [Tamaricihabitans halophyticus]|uniref:PH (Pleckstrin Homology) domain-containing protein n=1 Tax=Tamaricihabitans halophyticus TaxID=1262583 RepID=A0A4R2QWI7_9PSEU|nr:hypothetical protein [Tamaricihabitans halophyticus]TCP54067.1 hypothetical protein EV191_103108 [Tamaricihabitans halophyticus]
MPPKPPAGREPAIVVQQTPSYVLRSLVGTLLLIFALFVTLAVGGVLSSMGWARFLIAALAIAVVALGYWQNSYAAGKDWFRRGFYWVDTTELTELIVRKKSVRMQDSSTKRTASVPIRVLESNQQLRETLTKGVRKSVASGTLQTNQRARDLFAIKRK